MEKFPASVRQYLNCPFFGLNTSGCMSSSQINHVFKIGYRALKTEVGCYGGLDVQTQSCSYWLKVYNEEKEVHIL